MNDRTCPCGAPAANPRGVPRCAECVIEKKRRYHRERKARESGTSHRKREDLPRRGELVTAECRWCEREFSYLYQQGPRVKCDDCKKRSNAELRAAWQKAHPDRIRKIKSRYNATLHGQAAAAAFRQEYRFRKYGIDESWFEATLLAQGGRCAICYAGEPGGRHGTWHIDHDASCCSGSWPYCGQCVRGILCDACNKGIGHFDDTPERLRRAAEYLDEESNDRQQEGARRGSHRRARREARGRPPVAGEGVRVR